MLPRPADRALPLWLAILALAVAALHQRVLVPFMGEDEPWHMEYVEHVAAGHWPASSQVGDPARLRELSLSQVQIGARFPTATAEEIRAVQAELLAALDENRVWERVDWAENPRGATSFDAIHLGITAAAQPPVYYLLAGAWLQLCPSDDVTERLRWVRYLSLLCFLVVVLACHGTAAILGGPAPAAAAGALAAMLPMHARHAATVNPDVLAKVVVALAIWGAARWLIDRRARWMATVAACAAIAPWVKSTAVTAAVPALAIAVVALRQRLGTRTAIVGALGAGAAGLGLLAALGSSPVVPADLGRALARLREGLALGSVVELYRTLLGAFGWYGRSLPSWFAVLALVPLSVGAVGGLRAVRRSTLSEGGPNRGVLALLAASLAAQLAAIALRGEAVGRYLYPALPAATALFACGWWSAFGRRGERWAAPLIAFFLALWMGLAVVDGAYVNERLRVGW